MNINACMNELLVIVGTVNCLFPVFLYIHSPKPSHVKSSHCTIIIESVDSICRDGADTPIQK